MSRLDYEECKTRVLMVCMGNICRSPMAEGVLREIAVRRGLDHRLEIDSAGTHAYHEGEAPDSRSVRAAAARGYDLSALRARCVSPEDFEYFDWILAMDRQNLANLERRCPIHLRIKLRLFLSFAESRMDGSEVPDPYYGGADGFVRVLALCEKGALGFLDSQFPVD